MVRFFSRYWLNVLSVIIDALAIILALVLAFSLRNSWLLNYFPPTQDFFVYWQALPGVVGSLVIIFIGSGLYKKSNRRSKIIETGLMIRAVTFWLICLMALAYLVKFEYSRLIMVQLWFWALLCLTIGRILVQYIRRYVSVIAWLRTRTLVFGFNSYSQEIMKKIIADASYEFIGYFSQQQLIEPVARVYSGQPNDLYQLINKYKVQQVFIADDKLSAEEVLRLIDNCPDRAVSFKVAANVFPLVQNYIWAKDSLGLLPFSELDELPEVDLSRAGGGLVYRIVKRVMDFILAGLSLIVLSPVYLLIAGLIKKSSPGPVLIIQERVGKNGQLFKMYKFRTMVPQANLYESAPTTSTDPRITAIGKILRRFSLDELPQLFNILKGDMSIVGPRPEMLFIVEHYNSWQRQRLLVKPGLTGLWQILGRKDIPLQENLQYDFYYISNQSILLDLSIIIKTIPLIIKGQGAF